MKKTIYIGTMPEILPRGKTIAADVFCKIEIKKSTGPIVGAAILSISGVIGPRPNGDAYGSCGQIDSTIKESKITLAPEWTREMLAQFLNVWNRYHLNDMHAECEHQRAVGFTYKENAGHVCPTCDYEIGTAWKFERIPEDVIKFLESLPDASKTPSWV